MAPALRLDPSMTLGLRRASDLDQESTVFLGSSAAPRPITRMLIVDDDPDIHRLLRRRLEARKYVVDYASSGLEALARLRASPPDVVFLDVAIVGLSGLDVLERIRTEHLDMAVIVMTAHHTEELVLEALRRGADDYLSKPFDRAEFETELGRVVERLTAIREKTRVHHQLGKELARAAEIQTELLPREFPNVPGFEVAACCVPAHEVGGDFYDWQPIGDNLLNLTVGDVMGKGMPAALLMSAVRAVLRAVAPDHQPAAAVQLIAGMLDDDLARSGAFVTIFHAQLDTDTGHLDYVDAGHGYVLLRRANGTVESLSPWALPLGVVSDETYEGGSKRCDAGRASSLGRRMSLDQPESLSSLDKPVTQAELLATVGRACPPPIVSARILLADDAEEMRGLVEAFLGDTHQVHWAPDGQAAFEMFKSGCYDLVVTDLDMPIMDGHQLVSAIRQWEHDNRRSATPIVIMSGDSQPMHELPQAAGPSTDRVTNAPPRRAIVVTPDAEIRPIVPAFLSARRDDVLALARALAEGDYALIQRVGHRLKGSGRSYGFDGITEIGGALEHAAKVHEAGDIERQIDTLSDYLARVEVVEIEAPGPAF